VISGSGGSGSGPRRWTCISTVATVASTTVRTSAAHAGQWANTIRPIVSIAAVITPVTFAVLRRVFIAVSILPDESCELDALRDIDLLQEKVAEGWPQLWSARHGIQAGQHASARPASADEYVEERVPM
jgi:hypothetical protein